MTEQADPKVSLLVAAKLVADIVETIIRSDGELTADIEPILMENESIVAERVDAYYFVIEKLKSEMEFFKLEAERMEKIADRLKSTQERLRARLKEAMHVLGENEIKGNYRRFVLTPGKKALVINESEIPAAYMMTKTDVIPDKEKIREYLEADNKLDFAHLEDTLVLRNYAHSSNQRKAKANA